MSEVFGEPGIEIPAEPVESVEAWAGPSQDEWTQTQEALGYISEFVQAQQAPPQEPGAPAIDPFEPDFGQQLSQYVSQAVRDSIEPLMSWQQEQQLGEAENRALDILEDDVSRNGEFMLGEQAFPKIRAIANTYFEEESRKHGFGAKAAESALSRAANDWREYEKALSTKAVEQHMNQLTNLSGAPREPTPGSLGSQQVVTTPGGDELSVVRKYAGLLGR